MHEKIKFSKKPLTALSADVFLNYTTTDLIWRGAGIANTLVSLDPSGEVARASRSNLKLGAAVLLPAGDLPFRLICHAAISGIGQDATEVSIRGALRWAFNLIAERRLESIVVPTLYQEANGMPIGLSADIVLRECLVHVNSDHRVKNLTIWAQSDVEYTQYRKFAKAFVK